MYVCRYLTENVYKKPVIVYNYPKDFKAFYMRLNDDGKTVAAMDVLVPKVCPSTFVSPVGREV
jgi:asparaginyl-tRNA synthetase